MKRLAQPLKFEWDKGNISKNLLKHKIKNEETEEVFVNQPTVLLKDKKHSQIELRLMILGKTDKKRRLSVIFTQRGKKVRIISARPMSRKERRLYEQKAKEYSQI